MPKKTTLVLQISMTFMMALAMSGTLGFIHDGWDFWPHWPQTFLMAWPIAFIYTQSTRSPSRSPSGSPRRMGGEGEGGRGEAEVLAPTLRAQVWRYGSVLTRDC